MVNEGTPYKFKGASGLIRITAPFPIADIPELPIILKAYTVALILDPYGIL